MSADAAGRGRRRAPARARGSRWRRAPVTSAARSRSSTSSRCSTSAPCRGPTAGDRFLLSKGHAASALYAVLARTGVLDPSARCRRLLQRRRRARRPSRARRPRRRDDRRLARPRPRDRHRLRARRPPATARDRRTYCLVGDGELNEGSVWEAIALAGHLRLRDLDPDRRRQRLPGPRHGRRRLSTSSRSPASSRAFGWAVDEVDGHDHDALERRARAARGGGPRAVVARTVKGYGVGFTRGRADVALPVAARRTSATCCCAGLDERQEAA